MTEYRKDMLKEIKFDAKKIGIMLLESITQGLYRDPKNVIREYIQNEYDAGATKIKIETHADMIIITGNSPGMLKSDINKATDIGISHKEDSISVGFRGIGIWSGISICEEIVIFTKRKGEEMGRVLVIDAAGISKDMKNHKMPLTDSLSKRVFISIPVAPDPSLGGTRVELRGILPHFSSILDNKSLNNYLKQIVPLPLNPNFYYSDEIENNLNNNVLNYKTIEISLNGDSLFRPPEKLDELDRPKMGLIMSSSEEKNPLAFYWYSVGSGILPEEEARVPIYKLMSFTIGDEHRKTLTNLSLSDPIPLRWVTGEFHILDSRIKPNSERNDLESGVITKIFINEVIKILDSACKEARKKSYSQSAERKMENAKGFIKKVFDNREEIIDGIAEGRRLSNLIKSDIDKNNFPKGTKIDAKKTFKSLNLKVEELVNSLAGGIEEIFDAEEKTNVVEETKPKKKKKKKKKVSTPNVKKFVESLKGHYVVTSKDLILFELIFRALEKTFNNEDIRKFEKNLRKIIIEGPK